MQAIDIFTPPVENTQLSSLSDKRAWANLSLKRLDQNHPQVQGNKAYKLKYNIASAQEKGISTLLTFGGAWSNHIYSTAAACKQVGLKSIGIIRGERPHQLSPTLLFAEENGMQLEFVSREAYREKNEPHMKAWLRDQFGSIYIVPEGGSNYLGTHGCTEILTKEDEAFDIIACACGTGATLAGLLLGSQPHQQLIGFPALKGGEFLKGDILNHLTYALGDEEVAQEYMERCTLITDYHCGGYAKHTPELLDFMRDFLSQTHIQLDRVYTAKLLLGLTTELENGQWKDKQILAIHTGGLQGGWNGIPT